MAQIRTSSVFSEISGKIDGFIFYKQGGKLLVRTAGTTHTGRSRLQSERLALQCLAAGEYSRLSVAEIAAWDNFARALQARGGVHGAPRSGYTAFLSVNSARALAGRPFTVQPPDVVTLPAPDELAAATIAPRHRFMIVVHHAVAAEAGWWRIRITPPTASPARQARPTALRLPTTDPAASFVPITTPKQEIILQLDPSFALRSGQVVGVEIMAFSAGYVRGEAGIWRRVVLTGGV